MRATPLRRRAATMVLAGSLGLLALPSAGLASGLARATGSTASPDYRPACDATTTPREARCTVLVRTNIAARPQAALSPGQPPIGLGYGPASLQNAYLLPSGSAGTGQTVAIVDAFDDPNAESDLAVYRSDWGLPPCTSASGCFTKVNQDGQASPLPAPSGSSGWATEESLDIDMVSAICPNCRILLVEANSAEVTDLGAAVNSAARLGAKFVSNSYGTQGEYAQEASDDAAYYNHPGVAVTASAGDAGFQVDFPAVSPHVVAVGGTSLVQASNARGWDETVWSGTGSGCSQVEPKPSWQADSGCANRTNNDVAAVADPNTGVALYDTYDRGGWLEVGGTSVSSPIIASIYALVGAPARNTYPAVNLYTHSSALNDVTAGTNGACNPAYLCTGEPGYDGPTGLGTPDGIAAFGTPVGDIITVHNPGDQTATQDVAYSLQINALDSASGQTLTYGAGGLPGGLSINAPTGLISGTPTTVGTALVTVTATDTTGASGSATFRLDVASPISLSGPGVQAGNLGQPALARVQASDALPGRTVSFTVTGLPDGLSIDQHSGVISGLPGAVGYYHPVITATDSAGRTSAESFVWYVAPAPVTAAAGEVTLAAGGCLAAGGTADGSPVVVARCAGRAGQPWIVEPGGTVVNPASGRCLGVAGGGGAAVVAACGGAASQQWRIGSAGVLVNVASGGCLTDPGSPPATGVQVQIQACRGGAGERWAVPAGPVLSGVTGLCADSGAGTTGHLQVWYCGATGAQAWVVRPDGTVRDGGRCLTVTGTSITLARCGAAGGQQWQVHPDGTLVDPGSGKCLADPGDAPVVGTAPTLADCALTPGQLWHIE